MTKEVWKQTELSGIPCRVSNMGKIIREDWDMEVHQSLGSKKYKYVTLNNTKFKVHRVVLETFTPMPDNIKKLPPMHRCTDHINDDHLDNRVENLRWISRSENTRKANYLRYFLFF